MVAQAAVWTDDDVYGIEHGELGVAKYKPDKLLAWIERHKVRLAVSGTYWTEWCDKNGITEWSRKKLAREAKRGGKLSYAFIDQFVTPANLLVEDLYGWGSNDQNG